MTRCLVLKLGIAFSAAISLYLALCTSPYSLGSDASYYLLQAKYLLLQGQVKIPDSSFLHLITAGFAALGLSFEKAFAVNLSLLYFALLFCFSFLLSPSRKSILLLALWILCSPSLVFLLIEFPKMFSGLVLLPLGFHFCFQKKWLPLLIVGVILTICHRLMIVFSGFFFLFFCWNLRGKIKYLFLSMAVLAALFLFYQKGLKDAFHVQDLLRLKSGLGYPALFVLFSRDSLPLLIKLELVLSLGFAPILFFRSRDKKNLAALFFLIPAFLPLQSREVLGALERFALLIPLFVMIAASFVIRERSNEKLFSKSLKILFTLLFITTLLSTPWRLKAAYPSSLNPNYQEMDALIRQMQGKEIPLLIANKSFAYFYKYRLMRESFPYEPEDHWDKIKLWRLSSLITAEELLYYLPSWCHLHSGNLIALENPNYFLIRENCWDHFRSQIKALENEDLYERVWDSSLNPSQKRPAFLYPKYRGNDPDKEFPALPVTGRTTY